jgi:hypothetical protein
MAKFTGSLLELRGAGKDKFRCRPVRLAYQPPASSTFLSEQTSHQQPASSTFLSEQISHHQPASSTFLSQQISISHQPSAKRTG